jgi:hypothetical protein
VICEFTGVVGREEGEWRVRFTRVPGEKREWNEMWRELGKVKGRRTKGAEKGIQG